jgi:hypothetical protein
LRSGFGGAIKAMDTINVLRAREEFRTGRPLKHLLLVGGLFVVWVLIVSPFAFRWLFDAFGIAAAAFAYFVVLQKQPLFLACPNCGKVIASNTPWVCGECETRNLNTAKFPFINQCESCGVEPKAYKCHHQNCGRLIFLGPDRQTENYAYFASAAPPPAVDKTIAQKREIEEKKNEILLERLDQKLRELKGQDKNLSGQGKFAEALEEAKQFVTELRLVDMVVEAQKRANREECKGDEEEIICRDLAAEAWGRRKKGEE